MISRAGALEYPFDSRLFEGFEGCYLRVITLEDRVTIRNAFPDRGFKP